MDADQVRYLAYMLRLWQVHIDGEVRWRASIEDPHTGERRGFADLEALFGFLANQLRGMPVRGNKTDEI